MDDKNSDEPSNAEVFGIEVQFLKGYGCIEGACINSGAQRTVFGKQQAEMYSRLCEEDLDMSDSGTSYKFGSTAYCCCDTSHVIRIPLSQAHFIPIDAEILNLNISVSLGFSTRNKFKTIVGVENNSMKSKCENSH